VNSTQLLITVAYAIVMAISVVVFAIIVRSTRTKATEAPAHEKLARNEVRWGYAVIAMLVVLLALTIFQVPYTQTSADASNAQRVVVDAQQFAFTLRPNRVEAGRPVEFSMTSRDVQHGFGIYQGSKLIFQVQVPAVGEHVQKYVHTFDEAGTYEVLCLEFCGFQHHLMRGQLRVG
jgi:cytochrome c oxidase subunit 2